MPAAAPPSVQRIEFIFRDNLRVAWVELCSLVEGRSYETLLVQKENIMASFKGLAEFSRQDLSYHGKKLKAIFSKTRRIKKARGKATSSKILVGGQGCLLRQELSELDSYIEDLRDQVVSRDFAISSLEVEKTESALRIASLEEIIEKGQGNV
ncbi:hypothetical protein LIER_37979 [Lithospermum erythrorhizon]|uniref:Uncharacterized protein n=1 Tax=Lithospermum erythrorhizon TaxID=34254 RepID=A0AAV3PXZ5_LITER